MPEGWVIRAATEFWSSAPDNLSAFPRPIIRAAPWVLPLGVSIFPNLWIDTIRRRLDILGIPHGLSVPNCRLHGCLIASAGHGLVFVDVEDSENEQRYTVAHEIGHFVADYLEPRRRAVERIGPQVLEVLDGIRPATADERFRAVLAGQHLGVHVHLRNKSGGAPEVESRADRLALELIAPESEALVRIAAQPNTDPANSLSMAFGIPMAIARQYSRWLVPPTLAVLGGWLLPSMTDDHR